MKRLNPVGSLLGLLLTLILFIGLGVSLLFDRGLAFNPGKVSAKSIVGVTIKGFSSHAGFEKQCSYCHDPFKSTLATRCLDCHTDIAQQISSKQGVHGQFANGNECAQCHPEHKGRGFDPTKASFQLFDHSTTGFSLNWHQINYDASPMECSECHKNASYAIVEFLEECIENMNAGVPIEDCINQSSDKTVEMTEIIMTTSDLMNLGDNQASSEQMKLSLSTLLSFTANLKTENNQADPKPVQVPLGMRIREFLRGGASIRLLISRMALVLGITALLILLSGGLVITSAKSLPGEPLYPVKLAVEDITVYLVPSREIRQEYEVNYSQQRIDEVNQLIALNRIQRISFEGVLDVKNPTNWTVNGIPVMIQADTTFVGILTGTKPFVNGSVVEVEGSTNLHGGVTANEIHLRQYQFTGRVEKIDKNSWQISGINLSVTPRTQVEQGIQVGDKVKVLIRSEDEGLYALSIQSAGTPGSTPLINSTSQSNSDMLEDPSEHHEIEIHKEISTPDVEQGLDEEPRHTEVQVTAEPPRDNEPEGSPTVEPSQSQETENHEGVATPTPEHHESPESTQAPEETP